MVKFIVREDQGAEEVPGRGGAQNQDELAPVLSTARLSAGDTNTRFFHQMANMRRRLNDIHGMRIGDQVISDQAAVGLASAEHFRDFYHWGLAN